MQQALKYLNTPLPAFFAKRSGKLLTLRVFRNFDFPALVLKNPKPSVSCQY
jgi:hypothetical protein